jgi:Glycine rich protein
MRAARTMLTTGVLFVAAGLSRAATYTYNEDGKIDTFTAPITGVYDITAIGASGGEGDGGGLGGDGAWVEGAFSLTSGQTLDILVGQQGSPGLPEGAGGGGGGTFVVIEGSPDTPLLIAGGGGGGGEASGDNGQPAHSLSLQTGGGGAGGAGPLGGGGGGFSGDGADTIDSAIAGKAFENPTHSGEGGIGDNEGGDGGFGGGGGGVRPTGGGGGGYTGGKGGNGAGGDAGTSYYNPDYLFGSIEQYSSASAAGDGLVSITFTPPSQGNLAPSPMAAEGGALILGCLWGMQWWRRKRGGARS